MKKILLLSVLSMTLSMAEVSAVDSKTAAEKALSAWDGFQCSYLYAKTRQGEQLSASFAKAYKDGNNFVEYWYEDKIEKKHIKEIVPEGVKRNLQGPTPDFILGRVYNHAIRLTYEGLKEKTRDVNDSKKILEIINEEIKERNCEEWLAKK